MKVAIYQTSPILFDLQANLEDIISKIHQGKEKGAQLIVFPELALTGYFVGRKFHRVARRLDSKEIKELTSATKGTAAVVGFIEESPSMNFYNSALVAIDGEILFAYRKLNLYLIPRKIPWAPNSAISRPGALSIHSMPESLVSTISVLTVWEKRLGKKRDPS
jgi:predicted amidohydrolase